MIERYPAQSRVGQSGELHHVATLLAGHLGLRAHVARIAGRLRLVRLQKDVNLERVVRERHQPDSFSVLKWSVKRGKMGERRRRRRC